MRERLLWVSRLQGHLRRQVYLGSKGTVYKLASKLASVGALRAQASKVDSLKPCKYMHLGLVE